MPTSYTLTASLAASVPPAQLQALIDALVAAVAGTQGVELTAASFNVAVPTPAAAAAKGA
jgi:hypothetical protein